MLPLNKTFPCFSLCSLSLIIVVLYVLMLSGSFGDNFRLYTRAHLSEMTSKLVCSFFFIIVCLSEFVCAWRRYSSVLHSLPSTINCACLHLRFVHPVKALVSADPRHQSQSSGSAPPSIHPSIHPSSPSIHPSIPPQIFAAAAGQNKNAAAAADRLGGGRQNHRQALSLCVSLSLTLFDSQTLSNRHADVTDGFPGAEARAGLHGGGGDAGWELQEGVAF